MPWLIAIPSAVGSSANIKISTKSKSMAEQIMRNVDAESVYLIGDITQKMCEMEPKEFDNHIRRNGVKLT